MSDVALKEPLLITRPAELHNLVAALQREKIIAVDTESNSLFAYREQVCLVQFSTAHSDFLLDPLALTDLSPLAAVFANSQIEKVFHAAEYDLICLKRDYGFEFDNLFDTMVAARILGRTAVGLGAILEDEFGVQLDKRYQRANWGERPLSPSHLAYARLDTHYLIALRSRLIDLLTENGLLGLAQEDFNRLRQVNGHTTEEHPPGIWRIHGAADLSPQQAAVLNQLVRYRERIARSMDRPVFKVINDHTLLEIARQSPRRQAELSQIKGMTPSQMHRHANSLLDAVERGLSSPPLHQPKQTRPNESYLERLEALRRWRKAAGLKMGVNSDIVLPRDLLYSLAAHNPRSSDKLAEILIDVPWRLQRFGAEIFTILSQHP